MPAPVETYRADRRQVSLWDIGMACVAVPDLPDVGRPAAVAETVPPPAAAQSGPASPPARIGKRIVWTPEMDRHLVARREEGASMDAIADETGLSRNAVLDRCDRLRLPTGRTSTVSRPPAAPEREPGSPALPAGHPITWGAISTLPYGVNP